MAGQVRVDRASPLCSPPLSLVPNLVLLLSNLLVWMPVAHRHLPTWTILVRLVILALSCLLIWDSAIP